MDCGFHTVLEGSCDGALHKVQLTRSPGLPDVAQEASDRLKRVKEGLATNGS